jgi:hypothetical protein
MELGADLPSDRFGPIYGAELVRIILALHFIFSRILAPASAG